MLDENQLLKILNSYNITSSSIGPTIYNDNSKLGISLDIKDSLFGYLTRTFIFQTKEEANLFLNMYTWFNLHEKTYNITLKLDDYVSFNPHIIYLYQDKELTFDDMLNLENNLKKEEVEKTETTEKNIYLANILNLTTYLINLKTLKKNIKEEKNNLKITENNLKKALLDNLTIYYGKEKKEYKKNITLDIITDNNDIKLLKTNTTNIQDKSLPEIKAYLDALINIIKEEELDEKHLINIYSNNIYKYNIEILNKQIEFVKTKITSEKNFNLKGSKIHNIDAELKSFLKNNPFPTRVDVFIKEQKDKIINKYNSLTNIKESYHIISGNPLNIPIEDKPLNINIIEELTNSFSIEDPTIQNSLILYNSFYKNICNYIIENNYPDPETIKNNFDFIYIYDELKDIIYNEHNTHYLINYFNIINYKTLDTFILSLINISKTIANISFNLKTNLKAFTLNKLSLYHELNLTPIYTQEKVYLVSIPSNTSLIYIPTKLIIDEDTNELNTINTTNIYLKNNIIPTTDTITVNKYIKINQKAPKSAIIITTELKKESSTSFIISNMEEKND